MRYTPTWKIVLYGCLILLAFISIPLVLEYIKPNPPLLNILPPISQKEYAKIVGIKVESPETVTFYTDGVMSEAEKKLMTECFLTAVVIPESELWVNLKMLEGDRIAPFSLGITELGRLMLEQDLLLKRATSTAFYPENDSGLKMWSMMDRYGADARMASEMRSWIYPKKAVLIDNGYEMFIDEAVLDVKQERIREGVENFQDNADNIILPEVRKYVLNDEHFNSIHQAYRAIVCGIWFKNKFLHTIYNYCINSDKTGYFEIADIDMKYVVWKKYAKSHKDKDFQDLSKERNRSWGGIDFKESSQWVEVKEDDTTERLKGKDKFSVKLKPSDKPSATDSKEVGVVDETGGIDFRCKIAVKEVSLQVSDRVNREWQLSESIGYDIE